MFFLMQNILIVPAMQNLYLSFNMALEQTGILVWTTDQVEQVVNC